MTEAQLSHRSALGIVALESQAIGPTLLPFCESSFLPPAVTL